MQLIATPFAAVTVSLSSLASLWVALSPDASDDGSLFATEQHQQPLQKPEPQRQRTSSIFGPDLAAGRVSAMSRPRRRAMASNHSDAAQHLYAYLSASLCASAWLLESFVFLRGYVWEGLLASPLGDHFASIPDLPHRVMKSIWALAEARVPTQVVAPVADIFAAAGGAWSAVVTFTREGVSRALDSLMDYEPEYRRILGGRSLEWLLALVVVTASLEYISALVLRHALRRILDVTSYLLPGRTAAFFARSEGVNAPTKESAWPVAADPNASTSLHDCPANRTGRRFSAPSRLTTVDLDSSKVHEAYPGQSR